MILYDKENNEVCKMAYPIETPAMQSKSVITLQSEDNNMKKKSVMNVMEERLSDYGFKFEKYKNCRWTFVREFEGIKQYVVIQKDIWGDSSYVPEIYASVPGRSLRVRDFVNDEKYDSDFFYYKNEEERIAVLNEIADIIIQYGIDELNRRSLSKKEYKMYYPTEAMNQKLYEDNFILTQNYYKKYNINEQLEEKVLSVLKKDLEECYEKPFEQIQEKLVELSAVYGNLIMNKIGGEWQYDKIHKIASFDSRPLYVAWPVLSLFVSYWQDKSADLMVKNYIDIISGYQEWVLQCIQAYGDDLC